jgi:hypothetical protein
VAAEESRVRRDTVGSEQPAQGHDHRCPCTGAAQCCRRTLGSGAADVEIVEEDRPTAGDLAVVVTVEHEGAGVRAHVPDAGSAGAFAADGAIGERPQEVRGPRGAG